MKKLLHLLSMLTLLASLTYCGPSAEEAEGETVPEDDTLVEEDGEVEGEKKYTLTEVTSPEFADAALSIANLEEGASLPVGPYTFQFGVENYELGVQTEDAADKLLANSDKGQHIHFIMDNDPYSAHYEPTAQKDLEEGSHVLLAFLSRSYHESVKNAQSYIVKSFTVGDAEPLEVDLQAPHMFYSRPKGEYEMKEGDKLLLDFFLLNTTLSADGNKVRATINGEEHMIDKWAPYAIDGLEEGEVTIKLELLDSGMNLIDSPFNPVERSVTLKGPAN